MAYDYNKVKEQYEQLNDEQKQQFANMKGGNVQQFLDDYNKEKNAQTQATNESNFTNQNGTNGQKQVYNQSTGYYEAPKKEKTQVNPDLNTEKFGETNGQVSVKEGTAAQTGKPDYQLDSDARINEITANLNAYRQNNPEYFKDRHTFNQMFDYSARDDRQKALLDTYWKKKEDIDKANLFTTGDSISNGMKDADITPDQLNYIKEYNEPAYREWMQKQMDDINLRIANLATPSDPTDTAELFNTLMEKLNLEPGDPYQIYDNWYNMAERLGVFSDSEKLKSYQNQLDANHSKMESIMSRYSASTGGTVSDALAAARMQKALAPYQQREVDLQNSYTTLLNGRNSNLAIANQSANALAMQAAEDQRVWSQRLQGLNFAMITASYRSPEQQAQLQLQTAQIQSDMSLLNQAWANDLSLYNQYATVKLNNLLQNELTDLSVEDEDQLKANLNNVLSEYYNQYGAIIQRPQAEVVEDVLDYAKKNGISVAEALRKNFIEPLQNKKEYKMKVAQDYGMDKYQQKYSYTIDENGNVVITASGYGQIPEEAFKTRKDRQDAYADVYDYSGSWSSYIENLAGSIKDGSYGGQCGAFCNDVLLAGGDSKVFGDTLESKIKACNVKKEDGPQVGYAVVFDLGFMSSDGKNHGHVGFISAVNGDGSIDVIESNGKSDETIHVKRYSKNMVDQMVMGYYKPSNYDIQKEIAGYSTESSSEPYGGVSGYTSTGAVINSGGWITDLEDQYLKDRQNKDQMNQTLSDYGITTREYNAQKKKYADYQAKVTLIEDTKKMYDAVNDLLDRNRKNSSSGLGSRHKGQKDAATYETVVNGAPMDHFWWGQSKFDKETANGINKYNYIKNNQLLNRYMELKQAGASFGAMQKSEWELVGSAASKLNWWSTDEEFENILTEMLNNYGNILAEAGVEGYYSTDID